tara:strand:- start:3290 stop:3823 length:534 start_codon:yes stop_codon:yes gene_type:complete
MISKLPFVVGAGNLPESHMRACSYALFSHWEGRFFQFSNNDSPVNVLNSFSKKSGLAALYGDPGVFQSQTGSWLEALGAWKQPTVLVTTTRENDAVPGSAAAYVSLCESMSVPLLGLVQFGGRWSPDERKLDSLPWCGWISNENINESSELMENSAEQKKRNSIVSELLMKRFLEFG